MPLKPLFPALQLTAILVLSLVDTCFGQADTHPDRPVFHKRWTLPTDQPDRVILTFAGDPATQQSVTWRTDTTVRQAIAEIAVADASPNFYRTAQRLNAKTEKLDAAAVKGAEVAANYHSVTFTGLQPGLLYAYRVGDGVHWSEWFQFRTASREAKPFSFLYVGDAQNYILELWSRLIRAGFSKAPDARFIIHAGDLVSEAHSERQWHEWFTAGGWIHGMLPSVPVPGNHEYRAATAADEANKESRLSVQWRHQFTLPLNGPADLQETAYTFDYQGVRIVALNSNRQQEVQAAWLDSVLTKNPNKWTVVSFHHPVFSTAGERDNPRIRELWKPIFDKHGVDLVLQGHDHTYARGHSGPTSQNVVAGMNTRDSRTGTVYVVSVSGGKMYDFKPDAWDKYDAKLVRKAENTQLFQVIQVDGNTLRYQAFTTTGELYDAFDLVKGAKKGQNRFVERVGSAVAERH
ncbi:metallophosphoesterase family protein [Nibrella viscosa]|uniref:Metallophosphoesterase family protein n=1 Tax=Nibrella viscosa TaxID=1084524 RepID=A0ABP8KYZ9_9BACT